MTSCNYCAALSVCAICGKGYAEAMQAEARAEAIREAAPELLEALREAQTEIVWWVDNHGCCGGHEDETLQKIAAAIAKHGG